MNRIPKPANRDEWLQARRPYFNASAAAALFDAHPFMSLTEVVADKLDPTERTVENDAMKRGRHLEAAIANWWAEDRGVAVYEPEVMFANGPLLATLDRLIVGVAGAALEVKSTTKQIVEPERYWWWQVQAQMHCADLEVVHIAALDGTQRLQCFTIERDDDAIAQLVNRADKIMSHVNEGRWPPDVNPDPPARHTDTTIELDSDTIDAVDRLSSIREQLRILEHQEKHLRTLLGQRLGAANTGTLNGTPIITYRSSTRQYLDQQRLRADHPDLATDYSKPSTIRTLRILKR